MSLKTETPTNTHLNIVPKLATDGSNWITYKEWIHTVMGSRGLMRHLEGTARQPPDPLPYPQTAPSTAAVTVPSATAATTGTSATAAMTTTAPTQPALTPEEYLAKVEAAESKLDDFLQKEFAAWQQIYGTINDALLLRVKKLPTGADVWGAIQKEYEGKSEMYSGAVRTRLQNMKCDEGANIRTHLDQMLKFREELSSMGAAMADADFSACIYTSLSSSYGTLLTALTTAAHLSKNTLTSDDVVFAICEEFDRRSQGQTSETVLFVKPAGKFASRGKGQKNSKDIECFNCGRRGHMKSECWHAGGGKEGQGLRNQNPKKDGDKGKSGMSANTAVSSNTDVHAFTATFDSAALAHSHTADGNIRIEVYDSGATCHISPYRDTFTAFEATPPKPITAADGWAFHATGQGTVALKVPNGDQWTTVMLQDVLYAPDIAFALISVARADAAGYSAIFEQGECRIISRSKGRIVGHIPSNNGLFRVEHARTTAGIVLLPPGDVVEHGLVTTSVMDFHRRMGHISPMIAEHLVREGRVEGVHFTDSVKPGTDQCESCIQAKITRHPVPKERDGARAKELGDRVHSDVWGPARTETIGGKKYFTSFTDDATRWTELYLLHAKSGTFQAYKSYEAKLSTQDGKTVKALQSDRGGEYMSADFKAHLAAKGTASHLTVHDTPQHNGLAEHINRTLPEHARAMLIASGLPKSLWGEAIMHAT
ncbi:Retrovirus-related Pol polyprotein from transposon TNT 1-94 [Sparassis crispa]|uniref:Retrovirus-related Pol polyprotein from transposon TNT 1-94 n=1 Tax=Sparassis crispa TaxID=139825 RepID=A0A401GNU3_9APHY|nr:Retrovirus-related Pol polyprotein from transposon TNT 1-94 [Sparassis crispa]GBE83911.1 Retrovirus-related Pol polyprotein from transposon TNT 1-94 [Sparassis crispa]